MLVKILHRPAQPQPEPESAQVQAAPIDIGDGVARYGWEGIPEGAADRTQNVTAAASQSFVPNIQPFLTNPLTRVNPVKEQGVGRAPGWQMAWMRKYEPKEPLHYRTSRQPHRRGRFENPEIMLPKPGGYQGNVRAYRHTVRTRVHEPGVVVSASAGGSLAGVVIEEEPS